MTTFSLDTPVGQIVAENWQRAKVLETHRIDYCCGGKLPLGHACQKLGVDAQAVLAELAAADAALDSSNAVVPSVDAVPEFVDHLVATHHRFLREEMPRLAQLASRVASVHGQNHPELVELAFVYERFRRDMSAHLDKEEQILFPLCAKLQTAPDQLNFPAGFVSGPIAAMESDHDSAGNDLKQMRAVTHDYALPSDACGSYRALFHGLQALESDTWLHMHKENNLLFPRAQALAAALV